MGAGRPPIHTDPAEVERLVDDYFVWIGGEGHYEKHEEGPDRWIWDRRPEPPTVTGLALHLGFSHKQSLYDYAERPEFFDPIKRGLSRVEKHHEIQIAHGDKCTGNIFALKNMGWADKTETKNEHIGRIEVVRKVIDGPNSKD